MRSALQKQRLKHFLLAKEVALLALVLVSFVLLALEHFEKLTSTQLLLVDIYEVAVALIFIAEFIFEYHFARNRRKYVRTHWFYLLAAVPIPTATFEILKGIRLLRLLKLLKIFASYRYERNTTL